MPLFWPSSETLCSQPPRWPMAIFRLSSASVAPVSHVEKMAVNSAVRIGSGIMLLSCSSLNGSTREPHRIGGELRPAGGAACALGRVRRRQLNVPPRGGDAPAVECGGIVRNKPADRRPHDVRPQHLVARP